MATALGSIGAERANARLVEMLEDEDQRVIPSVLNTLVTLKAPIAEATLTDRLNAEDVVVRQTAATGLARLKAVRAVPALTAAYERAMKDPTYVARAAILAAIVELDKDAARPLLERALEDNDWAVRVRAVALLKTVDPSVDAAARIRPALAIGPPELNELPALINPPVSPIAYIDTVKGMIQIELAVLDAPRAVANFVSLTRRNFFGGTALHRVVPNFVVQDGDPRGDGEGGPGYTIRDEINQRPYLRGTVGMALDWEDTGGSQFFITHAPQPHLDGRYTVFGRVTRDGRRRSAAAVGSDSIGDGSGTARTGSAPTADASAAKHQPKIKGGDAWSPPDLSARSALAFLRLLGLLGRLLCLLRHVSIPPFRLG